MNKGLKVVRASKTRVSSLPSYEKPKDEPEVSKDVVTETESSVGDAFEDIFGEKGEEVNPDTVSVRKHHVRRDDESDDDIAEEQSAKPVYTGPIVTEGVQPSKAAEVEAADVDDLLSLVMDIPPDEHSPTRPTSTPSKDDSNDADFGDVMSFIRADDEPIHNDKPQDRKGDKKPNNDVDNTMKPLSSGTSSLKPSSAGRDSTATTSKISYSSKFVPSIPASFYKDIQSRLEDLIFKFECLDNEYAALQKITHKVSVETSEIKKKFSI